MANANPAFTDAEYADRLTRVRAAMDRAGLDILLITDPSNMGWLTGYDGWSFYVHQGVIVGPDGPPHWWGRGMDAAGALRTVWMADDTIHGYDDIYVQNPDRHPMTDLCGVIAGLGWSGRFGVEMDNYYFSATAYMTILNHFSDVADATGLVNWCRAIKSDTEITYLRRAGAIVTRMHAHISEVAEVGMRKNDLVAQIMRIGIEGADGHWGDYPAIVPMAPSGMDATAPHLTWDHRPLTAGVATFFEIAGAYRRYQCPQSRTLFLGQVPDTYRRAEEAVQEATDAVLHFARPGATCADLAIAFNSTLARFGFEKDSRCGYSIGMSYPPDWGERTMSIRRSDLTEIAAGMVFHFMPALWLDDGGIEMTEPIVITADGARRLTATPRGLVVKS
ncbi:M24 family metallopeptidase [Loktanella sp. SALINAS62]|uniref:M24 family metallopeptidase n=1 Tax=Loktanella sp. SALINAS62 TaxID=2706124 RepID=UPI001B8C81C2|nr:M24 family metallopeptidase [Loktanella sp. SALINAS62]MBS1302872.1 M24 family metallopeptidase [Loktanella sp. SALINAS62]